MVEVGIAFLRAAADEEFLRGSHCNLRPPAKYEEVARLPFDSNVSFRFGDHQVLLRPKREIPSRNHDISVPARRCQAGG